MPQTTDPEWTNKLIRAQQVLPNNFIKWTVSMFEQHSWVFLSKCAKSLCEIVLSIGKSLEYSSLIST